MYEISFEAQHTYHAERAVHPLGCAAEDAVHHEHAAHRERYVQHTLHEEREESVAHLLEVEARAERHEERDEQQPHRVGRQLPARAYHLAHVDADEEDGHTTPEYLQVSHDGMYRQYPLHHYAPHHHKQRQPAIGGVAHDEAHIPWRDEVEQHDGWHVPERQLVVQPEVPVDGDVAEQVDHVLREPLRSEVVG